MKTLIIDCSPRRGGNCDSITRYITDKYPFSAVALRDIDYAPCNGCDACKNGGVCVNKDAAAELYAGVKQADAVVFVAPVYFFGFDSHTKAFIDRAQAAWNNRRGDRRKKIYLIAAGGQRFDDNFQPMVRTMQCFAIAVDGRYSGGLFFAGVDGKGAVMTEENIYRIDSFIGSIECAKK